MKKIFYIIISFPLLYGLLVFLEKENKNDYEEIDIRLDCSIKNRQYFVNNKFLKDNEFYYFYRRMPTNGFERKMYLLLNIIGIKDSFKSKKMNLIKIKKVNIQLIKETSYLNQCVFGYKVIPLLKVA